MRTIFIFLITSIIFLSSCEQNSKPSIEGLWTITKVLMNKDEMTPNARWIRFHKDFTQASGNGWFQHSVGTWSLDVTTKELRIVNTNGLDDLNDPFKITLQENTMTWSRTEEGQNITVFLERTTQLPQTHGDQLLGLWKLDAFEGNGQFFSNPNTTNDCIFFRWDKRFEIRSDNKRIRGVYNAHGHKQEVGLMPFSKELTRSYWTIKIENEILTLQLLNSDSLITRTFKRIHTFPN